MDVCDNTSVFPHVYTLLLHYRRVYRVQSAATRRSAWNQKMYTESESETLCITHKDRTARSLGGATGGV